jgi:hypothetical protein
MNGLNATEIAHKPVGERRKERVFQARIDGPTAEDFDRWAAESGLNRSELLRWLIADAIGRVRSAA